MKLLILFSCLLSFNLKAAELNEKCYSFESNVEGYSKVCVQIQNPENLSSEAVASIYKDTQLVYRVEAARSYQANRRCSSGEAECPYLGVLSINTQNLNNENGISIYIRLFQPEIYKCRTGFVTIGNTLLSLICPGQWPKNL